MGNDGRSHSDITDISCSDVSSSDSGGSRSDINGGGYRGKTSGGGSGTSRIDTTRDSSTASGSSSDVVSGNVGSISDTGVECGNISSRDSGSGPWHVR